MKKFVTLSRDLLKTTYEHELSPNQFPIIMKRNNTDYLHYGIHDIYILNI